MKKLIPWLIFPACFVAWMLPQTVSLPGTLSVDALNTKPGGGASSAWCWAGKTSGTGCIKSQDKAGTPSDIFWPSVNATSGQALVNDGSGNLSWGTVSGSSPLTTKGDLFTHSTVDARLPVGSDGQTLIADSAQATGLKWGASAGFNPSDLTSFYIRENWINSSSTSNAYQYFIRNSNSGGDAYTEQVVDLDHSSVLRFTTAATTGFDNIQMFTGKGGVAGQPSFFAGLGAVSGSQAWEFIGDVRLPTITNVTFKMCLVASVNETGDTVTNGYCARFSTNTSDTTWRFLTCNAATCTNTDSTVTVTAGTWYSLRIYSSASGVINLDVKPRGGSVTTKTNSTNVTTANLALALELLARSNASQTLDVSSPTIFSITGLVKP